MKQALYFKMEDLGIVLHKIQNAVTIIDEKDEVWKNSTCSPLQFVLYAKCKDNEQSVKNFLWMTICNVVSWTTIISDFVQKDDDTSY